MYTVLAPIGNDDGRASQQESFVADLPGGPDEIAVSLTHVLQGAERDAPEAMRRPDRVDTVKSVRDGLEERDFEVEVVEAAAPPAEGILELADELDVDLVVMAGRKRSPAGKAIFGSVTQSVILNGDVPVAVAAGDRD